MKKLIVSTVLLLLVVAFVLYENIYDSENIEENEAEEYHQGICISQMGNIVHGKWDQNIPDKNGALSLEFFRNETFIYSKVQEDETEEIFSGTWEIVEADFTIELKFDEFDPNIKQVLASDGSIYKVFPGLVDYNIDDKMIQVKFHYMGRESYIECEENRYFIDWFGNYLYKSE